MAEIIEGVIETPQPKAEMVPSSARSLAIQTPAQDPFLSIIERAITDPSFDVNKLDKLLQVRREWEKDQATKAYHEAMSTFKLAAPEITRNRDVAYDKKGGGTTSYSHATLDAICDAIVAKLAEVGITHHWTTKQETLKEVEVACILTHKFGHSVVGAVLKGPPDDSGSKNDIQAIGSTVSYLERYTLLAACGLAVKGQDTDGTTKPSLKEITCPECQSTGTIIKGKEEFGGGYVCWKKEGGCGAKFEFLPGQEPEPEEFTGKVLEMKHKKKGNKVIAATMRVEGINVLFWIRDGELCKKIIDKLHAKREDPITFTALQKKGEWTVAALVTTIEQENAETLEPGDRNRGHGNERPQGAKTEPAKQAKTEPAKQEAQVKPPVIVDRAVKLKVGRGDKKREEDRIWKMLYSGYVEGVSSLLEAKKTKSKYLEVKIGGLQPQVETQDASYVPYCIFRCFHASLFEALQAAKGKKATFLYNPEMRNGKYYQLIEDIAEVDGQKYVGGKVEIVHSAADNAPPRDTAPIGESRSPQGLF